MCTYWLSNEEIEDAVCDALDELQGDFNRVQLIEVLDKIKAEYDHVVEGG